MLKIAMSPSELAKFRHDMFVRGWMGKGDMEKFLQIGRRQRVEVWDELEKEAEKEGKRPLKDKMMTSRVMRYAGLSEKRIVGDYERLGGANK